MVKYIPVSIKREGLAKYLDRTTTKHNGFGYNEFLKLTDSKVNNTNLGKAFKVSRPTILKWLQIHKSEQVKAERVTRDEAAVAELSDV